jgi:hypothetical protein
MEKFQVDSILKIESTFLLIGILLPETGTATYFLIAENYY